MKIVCPHCSFSREVAAEKIPDRPVKVTCPQCQQGFSFDKTAAMAAAAFDADFADTPPDAAGMTSCPACGLTQSAGESCSGCGVVYAKWEARQRAQAQTGSQLPPELAEAAFPGRAALAAATMPAELPKAGFWLRLVACMIDGLLLSAVQFVISLALGLAGGAVGGYDGGDPFAMLTITWLCSMAVSITYYVFFTGYNGQTPGKMALRIQVVRSDGSPMSYGRAFVREIPGKFLSALILGIGYLMVAFDRQKQGLHDRIAGTYVIKL